jgi:CelD/BcsL family acetyltransferase involved in cellulose biosynthesis
MPQTPANLRREPSNDNAPRAEAAPPGVIQSEAAADAAIERLDPEAGRRGGGYPPGTPLTVRVYETLAAAEPTWRELESRAVFTPYQRFDWISHYYAARGPQGRLAIAVIEAAGTPVALLPLEIGRRVGARRATIIGCEIGNGDLLMLDPAAATLMTRDELLRLLREAARQAGGIDLISFFDQPGQWGGMTNPLLQFPHQLGPNHFYFGARGEAASFDRFDAKRLGNLKRRQRKLAEATGPVELRAATSPAEIDELQAAFIAQRAARFAQQGIANIFAEPHFVKFFRDTAVASLGEERPAMIFHGLYAGERIVATAIGTYGGTHYSQYINATSGDEDITKFRLIGILMHELFVDCVRRGAVTIDMGLGDFDYKTDWTEPRDAYDGMIPLTAAGWAAGSALLAVRRLKRAIKQHDRLWELAKKLRARLAGTRPPAPQQPE